MAIEQINPGSAPIVWSTVDEAFTKINQNFTELVATIGTYGVTPVNFANLSTNVSPSVTEFYDLGSPTKRWKDLYLSGSSLHIGNAVVTATGTSLNLPAGSTIGGNILDSEYFREIAVAGQSNIVAEAGGSDILTVAAGNSGITITTNDSTDTLTITNSGVLNVVAGAGMIVTGTSTKTVDNDGVVSFANTTTLPALWTAGSGIAVSAVKGSNINITNTGVLSISTFGGSGITLTQTTPGNFEISNAAPNINQNVFRDVAVSGQSTLVADGPSDTLTFANGSGINITTTELTDTITIENTGVTSLAASGVGITVSAASGSVNISNTGVTSLVAGSGISISSGTGAITINNSRYGFQNFAVSGSLNSIQADNTSDTFTFVPGEGVVLTPDPTNDSLKVDISYLVGNVYSDNSSLLVDAAGAQIVGDIATGRLRTSESKIALGSSAGATSQGNYAVAIGHNAAYGSQGAYGVSIGYSAGGVNQGVEAIAIGSDAGSSNQGNYAIALGKLAGGTAQGSDSIAIGRDAGNGGTFAGSIILNASGAALTSSAAGFYVNPIRSTSSSSAPLMYNSTTKELFYNPTLEFVGSTISTSDSSGLSVDVYTTFNTGVRIEDDLTVVGGIVGYINLTTLKAVVAASSSFADFQTRIAAL